VFDLVSPLIFGLVGSVHCLGMCGPLVLAYSLHLRPRGATDALRFFPEGALHHLTFHAGRLVTYGLLGALAAGIIRIPPFRPFFAGLQSGVSLTGGLIMLAFGLLMLGAGPKRLRSFSASGPSPIAGRIFARLISSKGLLAKAALGLFSGFLPCMLSLAMIVKAAATGSPSSGFLTMFLFGVGTVPVLFFTGLSASLLSLKLRVLGERVAGGMVMIMGALLFLRGGRYFLLGH